MTTKTEKKEGLKRGRPSAAEIDDIKKLHRQNRKVETIAAKMNRSEKCIRGILNIKEAKTTVAKKPAKGKKAKVKEPVAV